MFTVSASPTAEARYSKCHTSSLQAVSRVEGSNVKPVVVFTHRSEMYSYKNSKVTRLERKTKLKLGLYLVRQGRYHSQVWPRIRSKSIGGGGGGVRMRKGKMKGGNLPSPRKMLVHQYRCIRLIALPARERLALARNVDDSL